MIDLLFSILITLVLVLGIIGVLAVLTLLIEEFFNDLNDIRSKTMAKHKPTRTKRSGNGTKVKGK